MLGKGRKNEARLVRNFIDRKKFQVEFEKSMESEEWTNRLGLMMQQLIVNVMSSSKLPFNKQNFRSDPVADETYYLVLEKLLTQILTKYKPDKGKDAFTFVSSFVYFQSLKQLRKVVNNGWGRELDMLRVRNNKRGPLEPSYLEFMVFSIG